VKPQVVQSKHFEVTLSASKHIWYDGTIDTGTDNVRCMNDIGNNAEGVGGNTIINFKQKGINFSQRHPPSWAEVAVDGWTGV